MQSAVALNTLLIGIAGIFVLLLPVLPTGPVLLFLVTIRALTDVGSAAGGSLLPSATISAALGSVAVLASLVPSGTRLTRRLRLNVSLVYLFIVIGTLVPISSFGLDANLLKEPLRLASIVAIFILAFRYGSRADKSRSRLAIIVATVPAVILILTFIFQIPVTLSAQFRAAGTFSHPNAAAAFFSVVGTFCFASWWSNRSRPMLIGLLLSISASLMTGSLGGIISLISGMFIVAAVSSRLKAIQKSILLFIIVGLGIVGFNLFSGAGRLAEFESFDASSALQTGSSSDSLEWRLINWRLLLDYWRLQPILGQGLGTTYTYIMPLGGPPHSLFVQILVEVGVVGCVVIAMLWVSNTKAAVRKLRQGRWEASAIIGLMSVLVVNGSESNLLGYTAAMYTLAFFGGILCANLARMSDSLLDESHFSPSASQIPGRPSNIRK